MKLIEALIALCLLNSKSDHRFSVGFLNGVGPSWMATSQQVAVSPAYALGTTFTFSKQVDWAFGGGLGYSMEGAQVGDALGNQHYYRLQYIRAPFKVFYFLSHYGQKVRPKIGIGANYGYLLHTKEYPSTRENNNVHASQIKNYDVGATGLVGLNICLAHRLNFDTEIGYYHGLVDLNDTGFQNRNLTIQFGLTFELAKVSCY